MKKTNNDHIFYRNPGAFYPTVERGEGVYIYDRSGKRYLDGSGGAVVVCIGHGVPEIRDAILSQAGKIAFTHGTQFTSEAAIALADRIVALSPPPLNRVYYLSGGSEAVETTIKLARQYQVDRGKPSKYKVISRWTSYHGNTLGALALGGHTGRRRYYQPLIQHTPHIVPCYCYRCPFGLKPERCAYECADDLEKTILYEGPDAVSAFIVEPVVGATAGALVPKDGYFQKIRKICDRYDVLLIADARSLAGGSGHDRLRQGVGFRLRAGGLCRHERSDPRHHQKRQRRVRPWPYLQPEPLVLRHSTGCP
jgi:adenosylmethionine-8-amino-7-oxononanoate aminotransferase